MTKEAQRIKCVKWIKHLNNGLTKVKGRSAIFKKASHTACFESNS